MLNVLISIVLSQDRLVPYWNRLPLLLLYRNLFPVNKSACRFTLLCARFQCFTTLSSRYT